MTTQRIIFVMNEANRTAVIRVCGGVVMATTDELKAKANTIGTVHRTDIAELECIVKGMYTMRSADNSGKHFEAVGDVIATIVISLGWDRSDVEVVEDPKTINKRWSLGTNKRPDWFATQPAA